MMRAPSPPPTPRLPRQPAGIALPIALVFLVVLTIIGVTSMQTSTLQERMAGNTVDRSIALQAAEETLRVAAEDIESGVSLIGDAYVYNVGNGPNPDGLDCASPPSDVQIVSATGDVAADPCYFAEEYISVPLTAGSGGAEIRYKVTAIATGRSPESSVVLTSYYREQ